MFDDILPMGRPKDPARTREIKSWVRTAGGFGDDVPVLVTELRCHEEGCPDIETVIAVMPQGAQRLEVKFSCSITELTHDAVHTTFRASP